MFTSIYRSGISKLFGRGSTKKGEEPPPEVGRDKPATSSSQSNERGPSGEWEILEHPNAVKASPEVAKKPPPIASKRKPGGAAATGGTGSAGLTSVEGGGSEHASPRKMPGMVAALPVNQELANVLKGVALRQAATKVLTVFYLSFIIIISVYCDKTSGAVSLLGVHNHNII